MENYIAITVGAIPGATSFIKKYVANSTMFHQLSSRITASLGSFGRSTRGQSAGTSGNNSVKLGRISSSDAESQRWLAKNGPHSVDVRKINVEHGYEVEYTQS